MISFKKLKGKNGSDSQVLIRKMYETEAKIQIFLLSVLKILI